ncbi:MAG: hypothetical protein U0Q16_00250 [Bryobacteraceae bacterium]
MTIAVAQAQVTVAEGTRVRVRLDQDVHAAPAGPDGSIALSVVEPVEFGASVAIQTGAAVHGKVVTEPSFDLVVDRVQLTDGTWIGLRTRKRADAPVGMLAAGTRHLREGTEFDLYTDQVSTTVVVPQLRIIDRTGEEAVRVATHFVESGTSMKVIRDGYAFMTAFGMALVLLGGVYRWFGAARR